jgi:uncharacterized repeat protein (TIGR04052 family)
MAARRMITLALSAALSGACSVEHDDPGPAAGTSPQAQPDAGSAPDNVSIRFVPHVFERAFACGETYADVGSKHTSITPADLRFYVQDLALIDESGEAVPVELDERSPWQTEQVALLDFQDDQGECSGTPETNDVITGHVPRGKYHGVRFANGVPEALNHEDPLHYPAPLQVTDLTWGWLTGFRFFVAEVRDADAAASGIGLLHIGSTACTGLRGDSTCNRPNRNRIELSDFDAKTAAIVVDVGELFSGTDIGAGSQCHSSGAGSDVCPAMAERLGVDFASGQPSPETQRVYRVAQVK